MASKIETKLDKVLEHVGQIKTDVAVMSERQGNFEKEVSAAIKAGEVNAKNIVKMDERMDGLENWKSNLMGKLTAVGAIGIPGLSFLSAWVMQKLEGK